MKSSHKFQLVTYRKTLRFNQEQLMKKNFTTKFKDVKLKVKP